MADECRQGRDRSAPKLRRGPECVSLRGVYTVVSVGMEFVDLLYVVLRPLLVLAVFLETCSVAGWTSAVQLRRPRRP